MSAHPTALASDRALRVGAWARLKTIPGRPKVPIVEVAPSGIRVDLRGELVKVSPDEIELLPAMRRD